MTFGDADYDSPTNPNLGECAMSLDAEEAIIYLQEKLQRTYLANVGMKRLLEQQDERLVEFQALVNRLETENRVMRVFINEWLAFEESCIKKDGPYVSQSIPDLMTKAKEALAKCSKPGGVE